MPAPGPNGLAPGLALNWGLDGVGHPVQLGPKASFIYTGAGYHEEAPGVLPSKRGSYVLDFTMGPPNPDLQQPVAALLTNKIPGTDEAHFGVAVIIAPTNQVLIFLAIPESPAYWATSDTFPEGTPIHVEFSWDQEKLLPNGAHASMSVQAGGPAALTEIAPILGPWDWYLPLQLVLLGYLPFATDGFGPFTGSIQGFQVGFQP